MDALQNASGSVLVSIGIYLAGKPPSESIINGRTFKAATFSTSSTINQILGANLGLDMP